MIVRRDVEAQRRPSDRFAAQVDKRRMRASNSPSSSWAWARPRARRPSSPLRGPGQQRRARGAPAHAARGATSLFSQGKQLDAACVHCSSRCRIANSSLESRSGSCRLVLLRSKTLLAQGLLHHWDAGPRTVQVAIARRFVVETVSIEQIHRDVAGRQ